MDLFDTFPKDNIIVKFNIQAIRDYTPTGDPGDDGYNQYKRLYHKLQIYYFPGSKWYLNGYRSVLEELLFDILGNMYTDNFIVKLINDGLADYE